MLGSKQQESVGKNLDREISIQHEQIVDDKLDVEMERSVSYGESSNLCNGANSVVTSTITATPRKQAIMRNAKRQGHQRPNGTAFKSLKRCSCVVLGRRYMKPSMLYRLRHSSTSGDPTPAALYFSKIKACKCGNPIPPISTVLPQCKIVRAPIAFPSNTFQSNETGKKILNTLQCT